MGGGADGRRGLGVQDVLGCCFEGASERKKAEPDAPPGAPGADALAAQLNSVLDALAEEWGSALPLVQIWLPKARGQRGGSWLSVDGAPFRMSDAALLPFRERSGELCFCRGQGLPGRVWATGACEVIQDCQFVSVQQYSRRTLACTEGLQETICVPIFLRTPPGAPAPAGDDGGPVGVLEAVLASSHHAANGSLLAIEGRVRLSAGGTASVITSIGTALDAAGLSCCADAQHHGYSASKAPSQQAPPSCAAAAPPAEAAGSCGERSSFDAARIAAGFEESAHGSGGSGGSSGGSHNGSHGGPRRSNSMARTSSCRSFHGAATIAPHVRP